MSHPTLKQKDENKDGETTGVIFLVLKTLTTLTDFSRSERGSFLNWQNNRTEVTIHRRTAGWLKKSCKEFKHSGSEK
jgi:hypothetical protein